MGLLDLTQPAPVPEILRDRSLDNPPEGPATRRPMDLTVPMRRTPLGDGNFRWESPQGGAEAAGVPTDETGQPVGRFMQTTGSQAHPEIYAARAEADRRRTQDLQSQVRQHQMDVSLSLANSPNVDPALRASASKTYEDLQGAEQAYAQRQQQQQYFGGQAGGQGQDVAVHMDANGKLSFTRYGTRPATAPDAAFMQAHIQDFLRNNPGATLAQAQDAVRPLLNNLQYYNNWVNAWNKAQAGGGAVLSPPGTGAPVMPAPAGMPPPPGAGPSEQGTFPTPAGDSTPESITEQQGKARAGYRMVRVYDAESGRVHAKNGIDAQKLMEQFPDRYFDTSDPIFQANSRELYGVQEQRGKISSFMRTNDANLDLVQKISDVVSRSDIPAMNNLILNYKLNVAGDTNTARLNALMLIGINESARVLSSPTGAGVLTDEQRNEMKKVLSGRLNPAQVRGVIAGIRSDMVNREEGYNNQIDEIHRRLGLSPQAREQQRQPSGVTAPPGAPGGATPPPPPGTYVGQPRT